jgi:uncharacterized protein YbjT (DUF2867 family)
VRTAVTGGTGFVGGHLVEALSALRHESVVLARGTDRRPLAHEVLQLPGVTRVTASIDDKPALVRAFTGCDGVAHCAGINRQTGAQTYERVHVRGTVNVVAAAQETGVQRIVDVSFLRARPACGSPYHESKWEGEEAVRACGLQWTVLKPGMIFGRGDHMLDHLSHALFTFPFFLGVGARPVRPLAVEDVVKVMVAALVEGRLAGQTVPVLGPTELSFDDAATAFDEVSIRARLPEPGPFRLSDLGARRRR